MPRQVAGSHNTCARKFLPVARLRGGAQKPRRAAAGPAAAHPLREAHPSVDTNERQERPTHQGCRSQSSRTAQPGSARCAQLANAQLRAAQGAQSAPLRRRPAGPAGQRLVARTGRRARRRVLGTSMTASVLRQVDITVWITGRSPPVKQGPHEPEHPGVPTSACAGPLRQSDAAGCEPYPTLHSSHGPRTRPGGCGSLGSTRAGPRP